MPPSLPNPVHSDAGPGTAHPQSPSLAPILAVSFVGALGYSIVLPFLVFLVTRLGGNAVIYGALGTTYSAFQLLGAPLLGRWSDRIGRKRVLLLSQLGTLVSWGIFLVALTLPVTVLADARHPLLGSFTLTVPLLVLFGARAFDGLTGGNVSVANAYLADISNEDERSANYGRMAVSTNLGYVAGPALAAVLGAIASGEWLPVLAAFLISAAATLVILLSVSDPEPCELESDPEPVSIRDVLGGDQKECYRLTGAPKLRATEILALPGVGTLVALQFLVFLAFNFYYIAFPVHAASGLGWTLSNLGIYFAVLGLLLAAVQGPLLDRLSRRFDDRHLVAAGSLLLAAGFVFFVSDRTWVIYATTALVAVGNGLMWPSLQAALSKATDRRTQGAVQGFASSVTAVASIVGLLAGGVLYGIMGSGVFLLSAAATAVVLFLSLRVPPPRPGARKATPVPGVGREESIRPVRSDTAVKAE